MDHILATPGKTVPTDLSAEIIRMVDKQPGDLVTCRWLFDDHYRCNWWAASSSCDYDKILTAAGTVSAPEYYEHMLGWNRTAIRITLPVLPSHDQMWAFEEICKLAAGPQGQ